MSGKQAKIITPGMLKRMMGYVRRSRYPRRPQGAHNAIGRRSGTTSSAR